MATLVSETAEIEAQYATQAALTAALLAALRRLWPTVEPLSAPEALARYTVGVAALVEQFSAASISLSSDYYADMRARAGVTAPLRVPMQPTPPRTMVDAGIEWAMRVDADLAEREAAIQKRVDAAMQKAVMDAGRGQVVAAVEGDALALGFARIARPDACYWCLSLAFRRTRDGRLGVYKSRTTAGQLPANATGEVNRYHNGCQCQVVPIFDDSYALEPEVAEWERLYSEATDNSKPGQSLNDFRRAVEAVRRGEEPVFNVAAPGERQPSGADQLAALLSRIGSL